MYRHHLPPPRPLPQVSPPPSPLSNTCIYPLLSTWCSTWDFDGAYTDISCTLLSALLRNRRNVLLTTSTGKYWSCIAFTLRKLQYVPRRHGHHTEITKRTGTQRHALPLYIVYQIVVQVSILVGMLSWRGCIYLTSIFRVHPLPSLLFYENGVYTETSSFPCLSAVYHPSAFAVTE